MPPPYVMAIWSIIGVSTNAKLVQNQETPQSQVDVDFLGVQQYEWILNVHLADLISQLKHAEKISLQILFSVMFRKEIEGLK